MWNYDRGTSATGIFSPICFRLDTQRRFQALLCLLLFLGLPGLPQAGWLSDANTRIEQYRKGDLAVIVKDTNGKAVSGANVHVEMQRHEFGFGTAAGAGIFKDSGLSADNATYRDKVLEDFNMVTFGNDMKWRFEGTSTYNTATSALDYLDARNIDVRGHTMVWPHENKAGAVNHNFEYQPGKFTNSDIVDRWTAAGQTDSPAFSDWITQATNERITRMADLYQGRFTDWDVLNEPNDFNRGGDKIWLEQRIAEGGIEVRNAASGNFRPTATGAQQLADIRAGWVKTARQVLDTYDSSVKTYVNNFNLITQNPGDPNGVGTRASIFKNIVDSLNDPNRANAPGALDGIGIQAHFGSTHLTPDQVWDNLETLAAIDRGLELSITEYDYANPTSAQDEADHLEEVLTVFFSHPQAEDFVMWGLWDGNHWLGNSPMYEDDWSLKLSGQAFLDLVYGDWWTDEADLTDLTGESQFRAFYGQQLVTVTANGQEYQQFVDLSSDSTGPLEAVFTVAASAAPEPASFSICLLGIGGLGFFRRRRGCVQC